MLAQQFLQDGFVTGLSVLSAPEAANIRTRIEDIYHRFDPPRDSLRQLHLFLPWALQLVRSEAMVNPVAAALGDEILARGMMVLTKAAHSSSVVLWHSDHAYTQKGGTPQLSAWLAISPSFPENGCMKVVPGSHREIHPHKEVTSGVHQLYKNLTVIDIPPADTIENLQLEPGQMSLHDPMILHASDANQTDIPRIGFIVRYVTPDFTPDDIPMVRVRGNAPCPHLNIVEPDFKPTYEEQLDALVAFNLGYKIAGHN